MIRVLVADDHAIVRRGVLQILEEAPDIIPIGEASTGEEVLQAVQGTEYDVIVLDIALPDHSGLEILKQLQTLKPRLQILMLSIYPEKQYAIRAIKAGAAGYLTKESTPEELVEAIRQASQGGKYITRSLAQSLANEVGGQAEKEPHEALSDREYQVMCSLASGKGVTEIAAALSLSVKTVSTYRSRILEKLELTSTAEIIRYALERGLVS